MAPDDGRIRVSLTRTGGFAGRVLSVALDSDALSPEQAAELRQRLDAANAFALPSVVGEAGVPDAFQYDLELEVDGRRHRIRTDDASAPEPLHELLAYLVALGRAAHGGPAS